MKTTIDLPPDLVRAMKLRALNGRQKLKDVAAELIKRGLADADFAASNRPTKPKIEIDADGLPVIKCSSDAPAAHMCTRDLLALEQATLSQEDARRLGHAF